MCGLVGMAGFIGEPEKKMFRDLLVFDQVRGFDSTGVFVKKSYPASTEARGHIEKDIGPAQHLWEYSTGKFMNDRGVISTVPRVIIGHNRAATIGKVNVDNAHPFRYGDIVGAHNGSLTYWSELEGADYLDVDSKALFNHISKKGIRDAWKSFYGAAALTFYDTAKDELYIIRNDQRPLNIVKSKNGRTIFWASELGMITLAAHRNNVNLEKNNQDRVLYTNPKPHHLYTYKCDSGGVVPKGSVLLEKKQPKPASNVVYPGAGFSLKGKDKKAPHVYGEHKIQEFKKDWKKGTERAGLDFEKVVLDNYRIVLGSEKKSIRMSIVTPDGKRGTLDVIPNNRKELTRLIFVLRKVLAGVEVGFYLKNSPRILKTSYVPLLDKYFCSAASLGFSFPKTKKNSEEKDSEEEKIYHGPNNTMMTEKEIKAELKPLGDSCSYCCKDLHDENLKGLHWMGRESVLCQTCALDWDNKTGTMN